MNGTCNQCDNHCAADALRCERGYRAMGYDMGRELSGNMMKNMQNAHNARGFYDIGRDFADDVMRQAMGGRFEAKVRRFTDDAVQAAKEAAALREAGRRLAEAIAANAGDAAQAETVRAKAKGFAEAVAAHVGESARAEALRQAAARLSAAVAKAANDANQAEAMRASVRDFAKTVTEGAEESAQVEALRETARRLAEALGMQMHSLDAGGSVNGREVYRPGMDRLRRGPMGPYRGPMGPGFRTLPVRPGEGPREDRGRGFGGRFRTLPAYGGPGGFGPDGPWDALDDAPRDFDGGPWSRGSYDFDDEPRGFDHCFGGFGGPGFGGPGDGRGFGGPGGPGFGGPGDGHGFGGHGGPGGRGPGMPPHGGRPPFGRPPRPMPDGEMLRERIGEAGLAELMELSGRLMHHRPGAGSARGQNLVLSILAGRKTMSQRELQQMLAVQPGSISEIVSKLEKKGYVTREKAEDKRGNMLSITEAGIGAIPQAQADPEDELFAALDSNERETLSGLLRKLLNDWAEKLDAAGGRASVRDFVESARRAKDKGPGVKV